MPVLDATADVLVRFLAEISLSVAVVVAAVALVLLLCGNRLGPRVRYALWALVVLRLLLPVVPSSPTSVLNVAHLPTVDAAVAPADVPRDVAPAPSDSSGVARSRSKGAATVAADASAAAGAPPDAAAPEQVRRTFSEAALPAMAAPDAPAAPLLSSAPPRSPFPWQRSLLLLWAAGVVLALGRLFVRERRFERRLQDAVAVTDLRVLSALARAANELGTSTPQVLATDTVETPALTGVTRPRLLLPAGLSERLSDEELVFVFRHELAHLRAGDVAANWLLALLAALHWFNPFVHVAFGRLRAEREAVRDATALCGADRSTARAYGETLLRLLSARRPRAAAPAAAVGILEGRRDLRRRITMLSRFDRSSRAARVAGAALVAVVAATTLTTAMRSPATARAAEPRVPGPPAAPQQPLPEVRVERERAVPAWEAELARKLDAEIEVTDALERYDDLFSAVQATTGSNVVVQHEILESLEGESTRLPIGARMSAARALERALSAQGIPYHFADGAVYVAYDYCLPNFLDRRYYDVRELVERHARKLYDDDKAEWDAEMQEGGDPFEAHNELAEYYDAEELIGLAMSFTNQSAWERDGASMATWKALLVVNQSDDAHAELKAFLDLLLRRGVRSPRVVPEWERAIAAQLATPISVSFDDVPLAAAIEQIKAATGAPITVTPDLSEEVPSVTLTLENAAATDVLRWLARLTQLHVATEHGVVRFTQVPPVEIRCYEVDDIVRARANVEESGADQLVELIVTSIDPFTWDLIGALEYWDGMLIVRNTPGVHDKIVECLSTVRRALRD